MVMKSVKGRQISTVSCQLVSYQMVKVKDPVALFFREILYDDYTRPGAIPHSMIPTPIPAHLFDSDSDSSHLGYDSDSDSDSNTIFMNDSDSDSDSD